MKPLELWGGAECTLNRVGDRYLDQLALTGHDRRSRDLDLFAALGVRALRYPLLWERAAPQGERADWRWADERLERLRALDIRVIAGLVHHGSGPPHTSLLDPAFPDELARYARAVAERYPWLEQFTPINEPLTTARFSGLYGLWHPHGRDHKTFFRVLATQCRAVVLAMAAIREVTPHAQLLQNDDLGRTCGTNLLRYQAEHENQRRWLTFDLLCGRVDREHPLWDWLIRSCGAAESELEWFQEHTCPPDLLGIDHYLSSERYLDDDLSRYPDHCHGGNGSHRYADDLTAWIRAEGAFGPLCLLREAWERYGIPLALTEVHNGCTREEQMRWFLEMWEAAEAARGEGIEVRAVTAWALLGLHGWDRLVTGGGHYEPGVFDLRGPEPRPTAVVPLLQTLAAGRKPDHPLLKVPGWWRQPDRFRHGFARRDDGTLVDTASVPSINFQLPDVPRLLLTGADGTLGQTLAVRCERRGIPYQPVTDRDLDLADAAAIERFLGRLRPWAAVNAADDRGVDEAEGDEEACYRVNAAEPTTLARACASAGVPLLTFSSDLVFAGTKRSPYLEDDPAAPCNVYGRSKAAGENGVLAVHPAALIVRAGPLFGPGAEANFVLDALRTLAAGDTVLVPDQVVSPTYTLDLADAALDLLIDGASGIWHLANQGAVSWAELARLAARMAGLAGGRVRALEGGLPAPRPAYSALGSRRGQLLPDLSESLDRYVQEEKLTDVLTLGGRRPTAVRA